MPESGEGASWTGVEFGRESKAGGSRAQIGSDGRIQRR